MQPTYRLVFGIVVVMSSLVRAQTSTAPVDRLVLRDGDTIVFLGDELTDTPDPRRSSSFPTLVETFLTVRYPELHLSYINAGWTGDTVARALLRLDRDVLVHHPDVVVICLGLNDPEYLPFSAEKLEAFKRDLSELVKRCRDAEAKTWLISPPSVQEEKGKTARIMRDGKPSIVDLQAIAYNQTLGKYAAAVREVALGTDSGFVDWFTQTEQARAQARRQQADFAFSSDGRLPQAQGHALLAADLLRTWGAEPIQVRIELDWEKGSAKIHTPNSDADSVPVVITEDGKRILEAQRLPMPWPMLGGREASLQYDWEAASMCQFIFQMPNPPERGIILTHETISGTRAGQLTISAEQLQAGFNLATVDPLQSLKGVTELFKLIGTKNYYRYSTWRHLELVPPKEPELAGAQKKLIEAFLEYMTGYEQIIFKRPKVFDAKFVLAEAVQEEYLPTSQPARKRTRPARVHEPPASSKTHTKPAR